MKKDEEILQYLQECDKYVDNLKNKPRERMETICLKDEICFLKGTGEYNQDGEEIFYFGVGEVVALGKRNGKRVEECDSEAVEYIHITSNSYPFSLELNTKHVLKNYTFDNERKQK